MDEITVVVVEDHPLFRQGVVDTLSLEPDFINVGQAPDGENGLALIRRTLPDVAVVDVNLPGLNGQQLTRLIRDEKLPTRVILVTAYDDLEQQIHALKAGASAFCSKDVQPEQLVHIIRWVSAGGYVVEGQLLDQQQFARWLDDQVDDGKYHYYGDPEDLYQPLSRREMEVLVQITNGLSNKEIALLLGISHQTVKNHVTSVLRKLGVEDRTQAALYALRRGWIRLHGQENGFEE